MNYRHLYHAGNFSDVIKHIVLTELLTYFKIKETPFCFMDTHAGIGHYSLHSEETQKKQEYENGIAKLFTITENVPTQIQHYLTLIKQYNSNDALAFYPGSPVIARAMMRETDQLILCELHKEDYLTLKNNFRKENNVAVHNQDAYLGMKAFLPPKEKRGVVLIDPPFEITNEFECIISALKHALKHFRSGCYMIWYPVKNPKAVDTFLKDITQLDASNKIAFHFTLEGETPTALNSCGIVIINPPWTLRKTLEESLLPFLEKKLQATWKFLM